VFAYDLKNSHHATVVGERTSGDATSSTGEINVGYGFSVFIANGQIVSPVTHTNYIRVGVQPYVATAPADALIAAYTLALKVGKLNIDSDELSEGEDRCSRRSEGRTPAGDRWFPKVSIDAPVGV
jgi:C-terminal processing protease CtpA/Prc